MPRISSEAAFKGHPDRIADAIVDNCHDAAIIATRGAGGYPRVALKCSAKGLVHLYGEVNSAPVDFEQIARDTVKNIGYTHEEFGFSDASPVILDISKQSSDIDQGVSQQRIGAGDQGHMYGGAVSGEAEEYMPMSISLAHKLATQIVDLQESGRLSYLRPDGKCQFVTLNIDGKPVAVDHVTIAASHDPLVDLEEIRRDLYKLAIVPVLDAYNFRIDPETQLVVNGTGRFVIFGPLGDGGADCRKIIDDTYGGYFSHGGGGFHGKDCTKVDVTGLVGARYLAKSLVAQGIAQKMEIHVAYTIGCPDPVVLDFNTFGTSKYSPKEIEAHARRILDMSVGSIIDHLGLRNPIYGPCAWGGLFGRKPEGDFFPWEQVAAL